MKSPVILIGYSWRVGWSSEFPEFPDQEAEGGVLQSGDQTRRLDRTQQVSIFFSSLISLSSEHSFSHTVCYFHLFSVRFLTQWLTNYLFSWWKQLSVFRSVVYSLYLLDIHVIISRSIICSDRTCQHTTYCFPVWPVFLLTWCYSSHSRPAQLSIWAACMCVFSCVRVLEFVCVCECMRVTLGPVSCQLLELCCALVTWQPPIWPCQTTLASPTTGHVHTTHTQQSMSCIVLWKDKIAYKQQWTQ